MDKNTTDNKITPSGLKKTPSRVSFSSDVSIYTNGRNGSLIAARNSSTAPLYTPKELLKQSLIEKYTSCRWLVTFTCFITVTCSIMLRQCISMVVVCMESNYEAGQYDVMTNHSNATRNDTQSNMGMWDIVWDSETKGLILQSYFYTFPMTPLIGGYLSGRFSGKTVVTVMTLSLVLLSAATPLSATLSPYTVVALRCLIGLSSGGLQPSVTAIVSKWAPVSERAQIVATANAGMMIGSIFTFAFSGFICFIPIHNGWPFIFYVFCVCNLLALLMWVCLVYDRPDEHPRITWKERALINYKRRDSTLEKMPSPPWLKILSSGPFWGLLVAHMSHGFLFTTIGTFLPLYMADVLKFDIATNGVLSSLPFIGRFVGAIGSGILADNLMTKELLSVTTTRKIFHASGMIISSPFLIWMSYMGPDERTKAVVLLVSYWTIQSVNNSGFRVNHIDIAPRFAGVLNGMTTTLASVAALLSPIITSELTKHGTQEEWQTVFFICTGVGLAGALAFVVLGSGLEQEWARDPNLNTEFDVYFTEEGKKSHVEQTTTGKENGGLEDRKESDNSVSNHTGHVNEGFNDQVQEIIGHVKLSSSFRAQVRDFDVPVRSVPDDSDESTESQIEPNVIQDGNMATDKIQDTKNGCHINGCLNSKENMNNAIKEGCKDISTFHRRTRLSRENLRLWLPSTTEKENTKFVLSNDNQAQFSTHL
uniref:Sialin-like n=1 Tax=Crassostrea virginica TaxID=6565 RepID=A0A8B8EW28_CRAVI|nr:sialin-like [Crassostrea virginica]